MIGETKRKAIQRHYRMLRVGIGKTQLWVEERAKLYKGRYWKIENGIDFPKPDEREALARVFKVDPATLPSAEADVPMEQAS
jgi:transcriptional regulator with XRE-family HTH domain